MKSESIYDISAGLEETRDEAEATEVELLAAHRNVVEATFEALRLFASWRRTAISDAQLCKSMLSQLENGRASGCLRDALAMERFCKWKMSQLKDIQRESSSVVEAIQLAREWAEQYGD